MGPKGKWEAGYKSSINENRNVVDASLFDSSSGQFVYNEGLSSRFSYREMVHALYSTYAGTIGSIQYKAGIRTELALLSGTSYLQGISFHKEFLNLFPSLYLSKDLGDDQSIGLSYSTRIMRPTFSELLPYTDVTNPVNHVSGNPSLVPAYTEKVEMTYSKSFPQSGDVLNASLYYSTTRNSIQLVTTKDTAAYTLTSPQNIPYDRTIGSDIIYRFSWWKRVRFTTTFSGSYTKFSAISSETKSGNGYWNGSLRLNGEIDLPGRLLLIAHGELTTPESLPQGYTNNNKGIDLEIRRTFFHSRVTSAVFISDLLNNRRETTHVETSAFIRDSYYKEDSRMIHLHLNYNF